MSTIPRYPRVKMEHPLPGTPEFTGDSLRAIARGVKRKREVIDFNLLPYVAGHGAPAGVAVTHYDLACHHRFRPTIEFKRNQRITESDWHAIDTLEARWLGKAYTIHQMPFMFNAAIDAGLGVEGDLKTLIGHDLLERALDQVTHADKVVFKTMLTASPHAYRRLEIPHDLGRPTIALCHRRNIEIPRSAVHYIDAFRGFQPRIV